MRFLLVKTRLLSSSSDYRQLASLLPICIGAFLVTVGCNDRANTCRLRTLTAGRAVIGDRCKLQNGISVYEARLRLGERLADTIAKYTPKGAIDVVMPIPDSSRPAAMQVARKLGLEYREGFYKNRYIGVLRFRDGKISEWKEFHNPKATDVL